MKTAVLVAASLLLLATFAAAAQHDMELLEARAAQTAIDSSTEEMMRRLNELEVEYHIKKIPLFAARNSLLKQVKGFWGKVIASHPSHAAWTNPDDLPILEYLTDVNVRSLDNDNGHLHHYRVELTFAANPYFVDDKLYRDIRGHAFDGETPVSSIKWLDGKLPGQASFFNFFEPTNTGRPRLEDHFVAEIGHVFRYEFWPNPFTYHDLPHYHELLQHPDAVDHTEEAHQVERDDVDNEPVMDEDEMKMLQEAARAAEEVGASDEQ